jgi:hypothetical protein
MKRKLERGKALEELTKGSLDYTMHIINRAFHAQFDDRDPYVWIEEIFKGYVIAQSGELAVDEYYRIPYERDGDTVAFTPRDAWEIVELAYQPRSMEEAFSGDQRMVEVVEDAVTLTESEDGRWIEGVGITADVVNANGRRYPRHVLREAVKQLQQHLHESAGQGRLGQMVTGEADHPTSKGSRHPQFLETIINWNAGYIRFNEATDQVQVRGRILETSKGRDAIAIMEGGVMPGLSQRAHGASILVEENGEAIEEVTRLVITGYDLITPGVQSDPNGRVTVLESRGNTHSEDEIMDLEELRKKYPDLVRQIEEEHDARKRAEMEAALEERARQDEENQRLLQEHDAELRELLGLDPTADMTEALRRQAEELKRLQEAEQARAVEAYIDEQCQSIQYADFLKKQFVEAVKAAEPTTIDEAKAVIVAKRKEYDAIQSAMRLQTRGFGGRVMGPVIESGLGIPQFAMAAYQLQESLMDHNLGRRWSVKEPKGVNEEFAALYLRRFDEVYKQHLIREAKQFEEAEQTSDLNIPYSVMRAVIAEAFPELVATSIFDVDTIDTSPSRIYYEAFSGETGYTGTVTNEDVTADSGSWVALDYKRVAPGSVVVTSDGGGTTYVEGTDYVIDYANGELMALSAGDISDGASLDVDYTYTAVRLGERETIERGKMSLTYVTVEAAADRLATEITSEAIVFSRSQIGWDAVNRTLASLVRQIRRKIDQGILYMGLSSALTVASNIAGTWTAATDSYDDLVEDIGGAKVKVWNRYYEPTFVLGSVTNMDKLSNWDGFKRDGFPDAVLNANGFVGRVKGLPAFESTEFSDSYILVGNRELVMHRVYRPMMLKGPFQTYDTSGSVSELIASEQYYAEEYNLTESPVEEKGALVKVS